MERRLPGIRLSTMNPLLLLKVASLAFSEALFLPSANAGFSVARSYLRSPLQVVHPLCSRPQTFLNSAASAKAAGWTDF
jgi:hypothetical protein